MVIRLAENTGKMCSLLSIYPQQIQNATMDTDNVILGTLPFSFSCQVSSKEKFRVPRAKKDSHQNINTPADHEITEKTKVFKNLIISSSTPLIRIARA